MLCVDPDLVPCENFIQKDQYCLDDAKQICIDWKFMVIAVVVCNFL